MRNMALHSTAVDRLPARITGTSTVAVSKQEWPKALAQQMQAIRDSVYKAGVPLDAKQIAASFQRANAAKIQPLLDTLSALALVRQTSEGTYVM
jgi:hypothetical protein